MRLAIIGTVGVPANYGGFETLAENLVKYHHKALLQGSLTVYCSAKAYPAKEVSYLSAQLKYVPFNANGAQSVAYDIVSILCAAWNRSDAILILGVSGAIALPVVRVLSSARIITNIDGVEWRREKWRGFAKRFLRFSEKMAVRFSHDVIADNGAIAEYVKLTYGVDSNVIAYGGDQAVLADGKSVDEYGLPGQYAFSVCRIEPENNVHMILEAFSALELHSLVVVGNWSTSEYGRSLRKQYESCGNLFLLDPIYDLGKLKTLRSRATFFVHGHSAGGTNPSLVEAMHFEKAIFAFDCDYNRSTTEGRALFFNNGEELTRLARTIDRHEAKKMGDEMAEIAGRRYTWDIVAKQYFSLLELR